MTNRTQRSSDQPRAKLKNASKLTSHVITGIVIGWVAKTYSGDHNAFETANLVGSWLGDIIKGIGGISVIVTTLTAIAGIGKLLLTMKQIAMEWRTKHALTRKR